MHLLSPLAVLVSLTIATPAYAMFSGCDDESTVVGFARFNPVCNRASSVKNVRHTILFDKDGQATGYRFTGQAIRGTEINNTFFKPNPDFPFPVPGHFEATPSLSLGTDALAFFEIGQWIADDPMTFDTWYRSQLRRAATPEEPTPPLLATPEPSLALLLGLGILGLGLIRRTASRSKN